MSSHLHLLVQVQHEDLSEIVRDFKKFTSKKLIGLIEDEPESRREWLLGLYYTYSYCAAVWQAKQNKVSIL